MVAIPMIYQSTYWVYVDGEIAATAKADVPGHDFLKVRTESGCVLMDESGVAARVTSGRLTYARDGLRNSMYHEVKVQVSPGRHTAELVLAHPPTLDHHFPLAIGKKQALVLAGETARLEPPIPKISSQVSIRAIPWLPDRGLKWIEEQLHYVEKTIVRYRSDPIVVELNGLREEFLASPPSEPVAYVALPAACGASVNVVRNQ